MLEIKPVQEKAEQQRLALLCGITYRPDDFMYVAYVDEKLVGVSQFGYENGAAWVHEIVCAPDTDDWDALFIMGRQTVNFINLMGTSQAYATVGEDAPQKALFARIGFRAQAQGAHRMDLDGFFDHPCSHH